jgi:hypothetical protein
VTWPKILTAFLDSARINLEATGVVQAFLEIGKAILNCCWTRKQITRGNLGIPKMLVSVLKLLWEYLQHLEHFCLII